jgi:uncharacterized OsmC-like protein
MTAGVSVFTLGHPHHSLQAGMEILIDLRGDLSEEERKGALEAARRCYVWNSFEGTPKINIRLTG